MPTCCPSNHDGATHRLNVRIVSPNHARAQGQHGGAALRTAMDHAQAHHEQVIRKAWPRVELWFR